MLPFQLLNFQPYGRENGNDFSPVPADGPAGRASGPGF